MNARISTSSTAAKTKRTSRSRRPAAQVSAAAQRRPPHSLVRGDRRPAARHRGPDGNALRQSLCRSSRRSRNAAAPPMAAIVEVTATKIAVDVDEPPGSAQAAADAAAAIAQVRSTASFSFSEWGKPSLLGSAGGPRNRGCTRPRPILRSVSGPRLPPPRVHADGVKMAKTRGSETMPSREIWEGAADAASRSLRRRTALQLVSSGPR